MHAIIKDVFVERCDLRGAFLGNVFSRFMQRTFI
jgi:hypothetical protein